MFWKELRARRQLRKMGEKSYENQSKFKEEMKEAPSPPRLLKEVRPGLDVIYLLFLVISRDILYYYCDIFREKKRYRNNIQQFNDKNTFQNMAILTFD